MWGQKDTTIYYTKTYRTTPTVEDAFFYDVVITTGQNEFQVVTYSRQTDEWKEFKREYIRRLSPTAVEITTTLNQKEVRIRRSIKPVENGYYVTDAQGSFILQEGTSSMVFPLVREGVWIKYNELTGKISTEGIYEHNQLISNKFWIDDTNYIEDVFVFVDKTIEYKGGWTALSKYVANNTRYPRNAMERGITGKVVVGFVIMKDGSVNGLHLISKVHHDLDMEALRVVRSIPVKWTPGEINGIKVNMAFSYQINFMQQ